MAILTVSRQIAALGDEICAAVAEKLNYRFFTRKDIEKRIIELGFNKEKLKKFDERKPGFFASLSRNRDEYLDYLQTAILELASTNNCILIGRGSFFILKDLPNHISCRFVSDDSVRLERIKKEFGIDEKSAMKRITESDTNRSGFHKSFFNVDVTDASFFNFIMNSSLSDIDTISEMLSVALKKQMTADHEKEGMNKINESLIGQRIVNLLVFDYSMDIHYLRASISENVNGKNCVVLRGIAESSAVVEHALKIASSEFSEYEIKSEISVVQDFKAYGQ